MIMPEMDCLHLLSILQEINPKVKTILTSGHGINGTAQEILDKGAIGFIQKPIDMAELINKVDQALKD